MMTTSAVPARLGVHEEWNAHSFFWAREGGNGNERATRKKEALADEEGARTKEGHSTHLRPRGFVANRCRCDLGSEEEAPESGSAPRFSSRFFPYQANDGKPFITSSEAWNLFLAQRGTEGRRVVRIGAEWRMGRRDLFFLRCGGNGHPLKEK